MAPALSHPQGSSGSKQLSSTPGAPSGSFIHNHYRPRQAAWHLCSLAGNLASVTPLRAFASLSPFPQPHIPPRHEVQFLFSPKGSQSASLYSELIPQPPMGIRKKSLHRKVDIGVFTMGSKGLPQLVHRLQKGKACRAHTLSEHQAQSLFQLLQNFLLTFCLPFPPLLLFFNYYYYFYSLHLSGKKNFIICLLLLL